MRNTRIILGAAILLITSAYAAGCMGPTTSELRPSTTSGSPPTPEQGPTTTSGPLPTPDAVALFEAIDAGDMDAVATLSALNTEYFDAGGSSYETLIYPAAEPDVDAIATRMSSGDPEERAAAMRDLEVNSPYAAGEDAADLVRAGLNDADAEVREGAANAAYAAGIIFAAEREAGATPLWDWEADTATRTALLDAVGDTGDAVAARAVIALYLIYPAAADIRVALVDRYDAAASEALREAIVFALGHHAYSTTDVHDVLADARAAAEPTIRGAAAIATAQCSVPNGLSILNAMRQSETDSSVIGDIEAALRLLE